MDILNPSRCIHYLFGSDGLADNPNFWILDRIFMDNMLIRDNNDSFEALAYMDPVTNSCQAKTMFIDEVQYSIIDTPREYAIVVLSRPNSSQMDNPEKMKFYLNEIKRLIALIPGVYASEKATEIWQQYIANENEVRKIKKDYDKKQHKLLVISLATGAFSGSLAYFLTFLYPKTCIFMAVLYIFQGS
ncbi:18018_t:CDS:2 [Rhizophagus irregularis]|nr:18018_t:CDS:2 [Rhizophagus irregularis]